MTEPNFTSINLLQNGTSVMQFKVESGPENLEKLSKQINDFITELISKQPSQQSAKNGDNTIDEEDSEDNDDDDDGVDDPELKKMKMSQ